MSTNDEKLLDKDSLEKYKLYNEIRERINEIKEKHGIKLINEEGLEFKEGKIFKRVKKKIYFIKAQKLCFLSMEKNQKI